MTDQSFIPSNYEEWHHCITVECGLELTPKFINDRITSLQNEKDFRTRQFDSVYGREHRQKVIGWFTQARNSPSGLT